MPAKGQAMPDEQRRKISDANRRKELPATKRCPRCKTVRPACDFRLRPRSVSGFVLESYCIPCSHHDAVAKADRKREAKPPKPTPEQRFMAMVSKDPSGCWLWGGGKKPNGYGSFKARSYTSVNAHRWSYEHFVGPIPEGLVLDHLCRVRHCVNPRHLEAVTTRENLRRGARHGAPRITKLPDAP